MIAKFPSLTTPIVNPATGVLTSSWILFFQSFTSEPAAIQTITPSASPFNYTASSSGSLSITGGTVTSIDFVRAGIAFTTGITAGIIPMSPGDSVIVTYTAAPTIRFIPG